MASRRRALRAIVLSGGLVLCGAAALAAGQSGFWGTVIVAAFVSVWLTCLVRWHAEDARYRTLFTAVPNSASGEDDRVVLRALLDQAPTPMLAIDGGGVHALNRAARRMFATDDAVPSPPHGLLTPDRSHLRHAGHDWRIDRVETQDLGARRTVVALIDTTLEERAAETRAVRELLQMMGHEVMNGLAPVASLAESALAAYAAPERRDTLLPEILGTLGRRAEALQRFTAAYRALAQLPEPVLAPTEVAGIFADLGRLFAIEWGASVRFEQAYTEGLVAVFDRDQVTQALWALVRNAAEASRGSAPAASADAQPWVRLSCRRMPNRLVFAVSDSGHGVPPDVQPFMFRAFFTTKDEGTGVGLYIARQIARAHGGDLDYLPAPTHQFLFSLANGCTDTDEAE